MPAKLYLTDEQKNYYASLFHSDYGNKALQQITRRDMYKTIRPIWLERFGEQGLKERCSRLNRLNKIGAKNPMYGKVKQLHHNYQEYKLSSGGYVIISVPSWYTGTTHSGNILEHVLVYCLTNDLTEVPYKHVIHHLDGSKTNNKPENLVMLTISDHMRLHDNLKNPKKEK